MPRRNKPISATRLGGAVALRLLPLVSLLSISLLSLTTNAAFALDETISGVVCNDKSEPLKSVRVDLWTKNGSLSMSARTNKKGEFSFKHPSVSGTCFLEVKTPVKLGLSSAIVENVPGDETRTVMVRLKRGFLVSGRVTGHGKGLRGVIVKAVSSESTKDYNARVYGGGAVVTDRGGNFELVLTPGEKRLVLLNNRYKELLRESEFEITVKKSDLRVGNIEVKPAG